MLLLLLSEGMPSVEGDLISNLLIGGTRSFSRLSHDIDLAVYIPIVSACQVQNANTSLHWTWTFIDLCISSLYTGPSQAP